MDFDEIRYIGRRKLGYSDKETMRMTLRRFRHLYQIYKDDFDQEIMMRLTGTTYAKLKRKAEQSQEWF